MFVRIYLYGSCLADVNWDRHKIFGLQQKNVKSMHKGTLSTKALKSTFSQKLHSVDPL